VLVVCPWSIRVHTVTATDVAPSLLAAAREAGSAHRYQVADASDLPFTDDEFDHVVADNVLMDVPDMPAAVREAARVLRPGGHLTISVVHPFIDRGAFRSDAPDAAFEVLGDYFERTHFTGVESRGGRVMHFAGWSHPLQDYSDALHGAGFVITRIKEPRPAPTADGAVPAPWRRLPLFLWITSSLPPEPQHAT